ncbi:ABC transporter ATP-binding protein [Candidatus Bipolaricaulota bacterium]|nr:ABC transporter ATP-binding protein [Candidatus Bipolaricaulota bacterium]
MTLAAEDDRLLQVIGLKVYFSMGGAGDIVRAVDGVSYEIEREKTLGIVGESGCGKTVTAMAIMGLVPSPPGKIVAGEILYHGDGTKGIVDLTTLHPRGRAMRTIRGNEIAMIFQEPMTSLNPLFTIGRQIVEAISLHRKISKRDARTKAIELLHAVGIPLPDKRVDEYPHQLSGGMRQRAMIAMALSCNPALLIADEPTTALDVTIQAQVLELMNSVQKDFNAAIQFITHDLGVIANMADDVVVMYLGRIVESASVHDLFHHPLHPYTQGLMQSIPSLADRRERLIPIEGVVPDPSEAPEGCGFEPRCPYSMEICRVQSPELREVAAGHAVACWLMDRQDQEAATDG